MKKWLAWILVFCALLNASAFAEEETESMFTARDRDPSYENETLLPLADGTVEITEAGTYVLTGSMTGQVLISAPEDAKVQLVLRGASIQNSGAPALYAEEADKVFVTLEGESTIAVTGTDEDGDGVPAVWFKCNAAFNGSGSLCVSSESGNGIGGKGTLKFISGSYSITSAKHGISAKNSIRFAGGSFNIVSGTDGIHAEHSDADKGYLYFEGGSFTIAAGDDGLSASGSVTVNGGEFHITAGGGIANAVSKSEGFETGWGAGGRGNGGFGRGGGGREMQNGPQGMQNMEQPQDMQQPQGMEQPQDMQQPQGMQQPDGGMRMPWEEDTDASDETEETSAKGIKADGTIVFSGGSITIDSANDSIHGNSDVMIQGGSFQLTSGDKGIHANETLIVSAGTITITECYEGLEAYYITISGGSITLTASDDGLNGAGGDGSGMRSYDPFTSSGDARIEISGGTLTISAQGDGIDVNGALVISGGELAVYGPETTGNGALDYDSTAEITGGTLLAASGGQMEQNFTSASQGAILLSVGSQSAGTAVTVTDAGGSTILTFTPEKAYNSVNLSSPLLQEGETYTVSCGSFSQSVTLNGTISGSGSGSSGGWRF